MHGAVVFVRRGDARGEGGDTDSLQRKEPGRWEFPEGSPHPLERGQSPGGAHSQGADASREQG